MVGGSNGILSPDEFKALRPELVEAIADQAKSEEKRQAWLAQKLGKFGASSSGCFWTPSTMKEANNATVRKYIARKAAELDGAITPEISAKALAWGNDEELPGMQDFAYVSGLSVTNIGEDQVWRSWSKNDQIGATPDGIVEDVVDFAFVMDLYRDKDKGDNLRCLTWTGPVTVEGKNPITPAEHTRLIGSIKQGSDLKKAEFKYWVQVQQQIMTLNSPFGIFFTRDKRRDSPSARLAYWVIPRDQDFIERHGNRLIRAVEERDELYKSQRYRDNPDLGKCFLR